MIEWVKDHRKGILGYLAALGAVCAALAQFGDTLGPVAKWAGLIVAILAGAGVYHTRNGPAPAASNEPVAGSVAQQEHPPAS